MVGEEGRQDARLGAGTTGSSTCIHMSMLTACQLQRLEIRLFFHLKSSYATPKFGFQSAGTFDGIKSLTMLNTGLGCLIPNDATLLPKTLHPPPSLRFPWVRIQREPLSRRSRLLETLPPLPSLRLA
jgi:hypothetical protein